VVELLTAVLDPVLVLATAIGHGVVAIVIIIRALWVLLKGAGTGNQTHLGRDLLLCWIAFLLTMLLVILMGILNYISGAEFSVASLFGAPPELDLPV
jgi:hypothetical protein